LAAACTAFGYSSPLAALTQAVLVRWLASSLPNLLYNESYLEKFQPHLRAFSHSAIASALGVSIPYAADIQAGRHLPHPRHWLKLADLVGVSINRTETQQDRK
jgi:hypothetical protein